MKHGKVLMLVGIIFALGIVLFGCTKPPDAEKQAAKAAMDAAIAAGADKYAVADLDAAKKVWDTAESQMNEKKYKEAKQSYIDAKAAFEKAAGSVEAGKANASKADYEKVQKLQDANEQIIQRTADYEIKIKACDDSISSLQGFYFIDVL